ncbi:SDR family NAD(P)-dependent oxidoreductase [Escherichia coli]
MSSENNGKVWFITGASRGFGLLWATAALERGDRVAVTTRNAAALEHLSQKYGDAVLPLSLDVTDRKATFAAVNLANQHFGRLDIVLNNAGYGHQGTVEEASEEEARAQMETNYFGVLWITQAALPVFRAQGFGHLLAVSSVLGVFSVPTFGIYSASKFAVEGMFDALSQEVRGFGINVTLIEPAGYATDFGNPSSAKYSEQISAYAPVRESLAAMASGYAYGDPAATSPAILTLVDSTNPPLRLGLGETAVPDMTATSQQKITNWEAWRDVSAAAQG